MNTIVSHEGSDIMQEGSSKRLREIANEPAFPSVTDISDNYSFLVPENSNVDRTGTGKNWKEESLVTKLDPNKMDINYYKQKEYIPRIDEDIWSDVLELRKRKLRAG